MAMSEMYKNSNIFTIYWHSRGAATGACISLVQIEFSQPEHIFFSETAIFFKAQRTKKQKKRDQKQFNLVIMIEVLQCFFHRSEGMPELHHKNYIFSLNYCVILMN